MSRTTLIVIGGVLLVVLMGALMLGAFPPHPRTEQVQHVLPNDRFAPH